MRHHPNSPSRRRLFGVGVAVLLALLGIAACSSSKTTDATVQALAPLKSLKVLAVTKADPAVLAPLRRRGVRIYEAGNGE